LEKKIAGFSIEFPERNVHLKLPKFKIEFSSELKGILATVGKTWFSWGHFYNLHL